MKMRDEAETESGSPTDPASDRAAPHSHKWTLTQEAFDELLQALDSERERAAQLYQATRNNLIRFFEWRGCPFPDEHADETINRVARRLSQGEEVRELSKYFFGVARLLVLEIQKARAREQQALNHLPEPVSSSSDAGEQRLDCLRSCLNSISSEQRELIIAYYEGEKSNKIKNRKRLSEKLRVSVNTLRMRALRLREQLEECVEKCLNDTV